MDYEGFDLTAKACTLTVQGAHSFSNVTAISNGIFRLSSASLSATGRVISASGGTVELVGSTVNGGTLRATDNAASFVRFSGDVTLNGVGWEDPGAGKFQVYDTAARLLGDRRVPAGITLSVEYYGELHLASGGFSNEGRIELAGNVMHDSFLYVQTNVTVSGGGEIVLMEYFGSDEVRGTAGARLTLGPGQTLRGAGQIGVAVVNQGALYADGSGKTLTSTPIGMHERRRTCRPRSTASGSSRQGQRPTAM